MVNLKYMCETSLVFGFFNSMASNVMMLSLSTTLDPRDDVLRRSILPRKCETVARKSSPSGALSHEVDCSMYE